MDLETVLRIIKEETDGARVLLGEGTVPFSYFNRQIDDLAERISDRVKSAFDRR